MLDKIFKPFFQSGHINLAQLCLRQTAMHLQRTDSGHNNHCRRLQARKTAFYIQEFLSTKVSTEAGLSNHDICIFKSEFSCHDGVAAMGNVGERTAVNKGRCPLQSLYQIRLNGILKEQGKSTGYIQLISPYSTAITGICHHDLTKTLFHVLQVSGQTQNSHHLRGHGNIKASLTRNAMGFAPHADYHMTESTVIQVQYTLPSDTANINIQGIPLLDMIVNNRRQQIVGCGNSVEIAGEMKVNILHRHHLGITPACSTTL